VARSRSRAHAERSRATRARVLEAATPLFVRDGYLETTMSGIARAAGVAVQTLYLSFGSKIAVLEAALAAADERGEAVSAPHPLRAATDGPAALAEHARLSGVRIEREYPLAAVLRAAAADPEPAELLERTRQAALAAHARAVDELAERAGFTHRISLLRATEIVATVLSAETYGLLVVGHGWTPQDWLEWATGHLAADLFPQAERSPVAINA
jgi:AcrR family transcriptional regulator